MLINSEVYFVLAGEVYVSNSPSRINTTLGSCIAITAWHRKLKLGGMCHYLLPSPKKHGSRKQQNFYGCYALETLKKRLLHYDQLNSFEFSLFGGGSLLRLDVLDNSAAEQNINHARHWLIENKLQVKQCSVGGMECRSISLQLDTGNITLKTYTTAQANA